MDETYTLQYEHFELNHWWHVARMELIHWCLDHWVSNPSTARWPDVGCGTGVLLNSYQPIKDKMGLELDTQSILRGQSKGLDIRPSPSTWDLKPYGMFDLITLCDMIEHVEDDRAVIRAAHEALKPTGLLVLTVPALRSLWSAHDVRNHHFRRYAKSDLLSLLSADEWELHKVTYFSTFLFPLIWPIRQMKKLQHGIDPNQVEDDKKLGAPLIDAMLLKIFRLECRSLRFMNMPLGSSLLVVARKKERR